MTGTTTKRTALKFIRETLGTIGQVIGMLLWRFAKALWEVITDTWKLLKKPIVQFGSGALFTAGGVSIAFGIVNLVIPGWNIISLPWASVCIGAGALGCVAGTPGMLTGITELVISGFQALKKGLKKIAGSKKNKITPENTNSPKKAVQQPQVLPVDQREKLNQGKPIADLNLSFSDDQKSSVEELTKKVETLTQTNADLKKQLEDLLPKKSADEPKENFKEEYEALLKKHNSLLATFKDRMRAQATGQNVQTGNTSGTKKSFFQQPKSTLTPNVIKEEERDKLNTGKQVQDLGMDFA